MPARCKYTTRFQKGTKKNRRRPLYRAVRIVPHRRKRQPVQQHKSPQARQPLPLPRQKPLWQTARLTPESLPCKPAPKLTPPGAVPRSRRKLKHRLPQTHRKAPKAPKAQSCRMPQKRKTTVHRRRHPFKANRRLQSHRQLPRPRPQYRLLRRQPLKDQALHHRRPPHHPRLSRRKRTLHRIFPFSTQAEMPFVFRTSSAGRSFSIFGQPGVRPAGESFQILISFSRNTATRSNL